MMLLHLILMTALGGGAWVFVCLKKVLLFFFY